MCSNLLLNILALVCLSALKLISVSAVPSFHQSLPDQTPPKFTKPPIINEKEEYATINEKEEYTTINEKEEYAMVDEEEEYATINEKEVYATFLSTRVGANVIEGESENDWYYNSTRLLIHRLLRNPSTRGRHRVVVLSN
jgi:hypothetical protein